MPLKLNVGLSKKVGEANFSSRGASVNTELELESALVDDPTKLKDRVRQVFDMIRASVDEELNGHAPKSNGALTMATASTTPPHRAMAARTAMARRRGRRPSPRSRLCTPSPRNATSIFTSLSRTASGPRGLRTSRSRTPAT